MDLAEIRSVLVVGRSLRSRLQDPRRGRWTRLEHGYGAGLLWIGLNEGGHIVAQEPLLYVRDATRVVVLVMASFVLRG
jgi:hypothetical protein